MTADWGPSMFEPTEPERSASPARRGRARFDPARLQPFLADAGSLDETLAAKERELQQLFKDSSRDSDEGRTWRAEQEGLEWLREHWDEAQHHARCLKSFDHWLQTPPSRRKLFAAYCRHAIPAEWDRYLQSCEPPFIFPTQEKLAAHLEHCQLCGVQVQLAEGRARRPTMQARTWGDQIVLDFLTTFCGEALAAVCDPEERYGAKQPPRRWSESPPWRLTLPPGERPALRGDSRLVVPTRLCGPRGPALLELGVTAQFLPRSSRKAEERRLAFPAHRGGETRFEWRPDRDGEAAFPLTLPLPAEPGRLLLRYAVRLLPPRLASRSYVAHSGVAQETFVDALSCDLSAFDR